MAVPYNLMMGLALEQVTNGRASGDYAAQGNWDIGAGAILWASLGLKPSKDNFWTTYPQPLMYGQHPNGDDFGSVIVQSMIALLRY